MLFRTLFTLCFAPTLFTGCQNLSRNPNTSENTILGDIQANSSISFTQALDGKGTLYVAALPMCTLSERPIAAAVVPNADLSGRQSVEFQITGLNNGTYYLAAFLDEHSTTPSTNPRPSEGDVVYSPTGTNDGKLDCVAVKVPVMERVFIELTSRRP